MPATLGDIRADRSQPVLRGPGKLTQGSLRDRRIEFRKGEGISRIMLPPGSDGIRAPEEDRRRVLA